MFLLISIAVVFLLIFIYSIAVIVNFNSQVEEAGEVNWELSKRFKIKLLISGISLGILIGVFYYYLQGFRAAISMTVMWSTVLGLGMMYSASRTISMLKRKYNQKEF